MARPLGRHSRGEHWLRWAEASAADVVVLGATAHVCAPRRRTPVPTDAPPFTHSPFLPGVTVNTVTPHWAWVNPKFSMAFQECQLVCS